MGAQVVGLHSVECSRDNDRHRTYSPKWLVQVDDPYFDGPEVASGAVGLPLLGTRWVFGNDFDIAAVCQPQVQISPYDSNGDAMEFYWVTQTFSTKPLGDRKNTDPDNPLLTPPEISGGFTKHVRQAVQDNTGKPVMSSSLETFKGKEAEVDDSRHAISIKLRLPSLPLSTYIEYIDRVNSVPMWGLPARCVKLSNVSWSKQFYGEDYQFTYYEVTYEFEIKFDTFDRYILDEGSRVLRTPDAANPAPANPNNPKDFVPFTIKGQPARVLLDGTGKAIASEANTTYKQFKLYQEKNLLLLGIPATL